MSERGHVMNTLWEDARRALISRGLRVHVREAVGGGDFGDFQVELSGRSTAVTYAVNLKTRATAATVATLAARSPHPRLLLVAPYIRDGVADACRHAAIDFVDAVGNMYLDLPHALIDVAGRRPPHPRESTGGGARMFRPSGLRLLFGLLCDPDLAAAPYRVLAEETHVSLGSAQWVMAELIAAGLVEKQARGRVLHRTRHLFDRWVEAYAVNMPLGDPRNRFAPIDEDAWRSGAAPLSASSAAWGGETAAYRLDGFVRPVHAIVYLNELTADFLREHRLRRSADEWTVELRERFWGDRVGATSRLPQVSPSPLVYADLLADGDPRLLEAARRLRESDDLLRRIDAG